MHRIPRFKRKNATRSPWPDCCRIGSRSFNYSGLNLLLKDASLFSYTTLHNVFSSLNEMKNKKTKTLLFIINKWIHLFFFLTFLKILLSRKTQGYNGIVNHVENLWVLYGILSQKYPRLIPYRSPSKKKECQKRTGKNEKSSYGFWKINESILDEKNRLLEYLLENYFFHEFENSLSTLILCNMNFHDIFNTVTHDKKRNKRICRIYC